MEKLKQSVWESEGLLLTFTHKAEALQYGANVILLYTIHSARTELIDSKSTTLHCTISTQWLSLKSIMNKQQHGLSRQSSSLSRALDLGWCSPQLTLRLF
jgi:hypothetical protein